MNDPTIKAVAAEIEQHLSNRFLATVHQLDPFTVVLDFRLREMGYLLISVLPRQPRIHLIARRSRELEKASVAPAPFTQFTRSALRGAKLISVRPDLTERIVRLVFSRPHEPEAEQSMSLVAQLTGRSANLFLLDSDGLILQALRFPRGEGQQVGQRYQPPPPGAKTGAAGPMIDKGSFASVSAALDEYFTRLEAEESFNARIRALQDRYRSQIEQKKKLELNLRKDLLRHGSAAEHKRLGDLLLANISTAERRGGKVLIKDYYAEGTPELELEIDEETSLQKEAALYFARYAKAKRAQQAIARRLDETAQEIDRLELRAARLTKIAASRDETALKELEAEHATPLPKHARQYQEKLPGIRRYLSSDDYEILVGRAAQTNDRLTFKIARPNDLWLHTADYPGSHVIVRNPSRREIPRRTVVEAAQLAARFSQAAEDTKADVNYTSRKFLSKPKGAAPGLVRLSRFKTITVTPGEIVKRLK